LSSIPCRACTLFTHLEIQVINELVWFSAS
jgi:hypothetical protein